MNQIKQELLLQIEDKFEEIKESYEEIQMKQLDILFLTTIYLDLITNEEYD